MKLVPERDPLPRLLALLYLGLAAAIGLAFLLWGTWIERSASCTLRRLCGVPCPFCGGTHAALSLVRLDLGKAFLINPLVTAASCLVAFWGGYAILATLVPQLRRQLELAPRERARLGSLVALLLVAGWIYQILRLT